MEFDTKIAFAIADDLATWQKLNVVAFLSSGVIGATENIMGETYVDGSGANYSPLCVQPMVLTAGRARLNTFVQRATARRARRSLYRRYVCDRTRAANRRPSRLRLGRLARVDWRTRGTQDCRQDSERRQDARLNQRKTLSEDHWPDWRHELGKHGDLLPAAEPDGA